MLCFRMNVTTGSGWRDWRRTVADRPPMTAGELYTGHHWSRAAAAAARSGAEMWIISAGMELLHVSDLVVPYEATFSSMSFCHRTHWERLTTRPPSERQ
ncbi:DUF6884 domain-containing protein [Enterobacter kobei]|uniref:DUF6884 domain-containing protein n=1 Tax=Enterobacter kobei TaxID=208224 RepID=UPI003CE75235